MESFILQSPESTQAQVVAHCPFCFSNDLKKNGKGRSGLKQTWYCNNCSHQHTEGNKRHIISPQEIDSIRRMLLTRLSQRKIAQLSGRSLPVINRIAQQLFRQEIDKDVEVKKSPV